MQNETKKHMHRTLHPIKRSNKAIKNKTNDARKKWIKKTDDALSIPHIHGVLINI